MDFPVDMLLANGEIRHQARFPNVDSTAVRFYGVSAEATSPSRVKNWKNPVGGYLHAMHWSDWGDFHYRITGKDDEGNLSMEGGWPVSYTHLTKSGSMELIRSGKEGKHIII